MAKMFAKFPIEESHWAGKQSPIDIANYADNFARMGGNIADLLQGSDTRTFDSFQTGAVNEMEDLNLSSRISRKLQSSTFRFSEQKDDGKDVTVFLVMDNSRIEAQEKAFTFITDSMLKEWVRHPNKSKPVTLFLNEINNYKFKGLVELFSWCRKFNIRLNLFLQNLSAFKKKNGEDAVNALLSEADIKLFLPAGQRDPMTIAHLEKSLGASSQVVKSRSGRGSNRNHDLARLDNISYSEEGRPLMFGQEIREMKERGILFVGNKKPVRVYLPSIASIAPFRKLQGINPYHGAPYRQRVKLRLLRYAPWMPAVMWQKFRHNRKRDTTQEEVRHDPS